MMKNIFDYSEYTFESGFRERDLISPDSNTYLFFQRHKEGMCPFCKIKTTIIHKDSACTYPDWLDGGYFNAREYVEKCCKCGWWKLTCNKKTTGECDAESIEITNAILRKYNLSDKAIPINILQKYLKSNYEDVIHINDNRMEKLVQSVFSEHFNCEVKHIGKSNDGGIDLLLINSENPSVIQVKRRKKLKYTESVSGIRDLIGATLLSGNKNSIFVSTCDKFSKQSELAAKKIVDLGTIENFELYDFNKFNDILKLTTNTDKEPWKDQLRNGWF